MINLICIQQCIQTLILKICIMLSKYSGIMLCTQNLITQFVKYSVGPQNRECIIKYNAYSLVLCRAKEFNYERWHWYITSIMFRVVHHALHSLTWGKSDYTNGFGVGAKCSLGHCHEQCNTANKKNRENAKDLCLSFHWTEGEFLLQSS
jgi:hypothetical protein